MLCTLNVKINKILTHLRHFVLLSFSLFSFFLLFLSTYVNRQFEIMVNNGQRGKKNEEKKKKIFFRNVLTYLLLTVNYLMAHNWWKILCHIIKELFLWSFYFVICTYYFDVLTYFFYNSDTKTMFNYFWKMGFFNLNQS